MKNGKLYQRNHSFYCDCCHCSAAKSGPTLWDLMNYSMPGSSALHYLLEFTQNMSTELIMLSSQSPHSACVLAKPLQSCPTLHPCGLQPTRLLCLWASPGKNTGVDCHALLQGIFLTQDQNPCLISSALAGRFFITSATWEALSILLVAIFLLYPHIEEGRESMEKESRLWCLFIQGHQSHSQGLPKFPKPNTIILNVMISTYKF